MSTDDHPTQAATERKALAELDKVAATFTRAVEARDKTRDSLYEAIVRHLRARSAPPGKIADHTPYDRNHVGAIRREAEIPSLRGPGAGPAPVYEQETMAAAYDELDGLTKAFRKAVDAIDKARDPLHAAIVRHYKTGMLPGVIAEHVPYDRNHVMRIAREGGAPRIRA